MRDLSKINHTLLVIKSYNHILKINFASHSIEKKATSTVEKWICIMIMESERRKFADWLSIENVKNLLHLPILYRFQYWWEKNKCLQHIKNYVLILATLVHKYLQMTFYLLFLFILCYIFITHRKIYFQSNEIDRFCK